MSLPRGFKAQANRISIGLRKQLGLEAHDPIDLNEVAARRKILIMPLSEIAAPEVAYLLQHDKEFSALLVKMNYGAKFIFYHPDHHKNRISSSIAHELSHDLLAHPPSSLFAVDGKRNYDKQAEAEANWLGPTILIPDEAAIHILRSGLSNGDAINAYRVSEQLLKMRVGASGASKRFGNSAQVLKQTQIVPIVGQIPKL